MVNAIANMIDKVTDSRNGSDPSRTGGRLVSVTGETLPLLHTRIAAEAGGGLARVVVEQRFRNVHAEPLRVSYQLPLPSDGAVSGFRFRLGDQVIEGEIDRRQAARARFEEAIAEGKTAALLEQERTSLFTQEIGNIPPGADVLAEVTIDQPLAFLSEGAWEWRFPTVVGPRYLGAPGVVSDAEAVSVDVSDAPLPNRFEMRLSIGDEIASGRRPESPSHPIDAERVDGSMRVALQAELGARLDRDVVVRWLVAKPAVGLSAKLARPARPELQGSMFGLITLVPPDPGHAPAPIARDLIVLLDVSGSMSGAPLEQGTRIVSAMVESLEPEDRLEMMAFAGSAVRWTKEPVRASKESKREALRWLKNLRAGGGTEMVQATLEALRPLREDAQRQVVIVTDGYIGFEQRLVQTILEKLPKGSRFHTVGVGSAPNRSLTQSAARAGGGVEVIVGLEEDVERGAKRIMDRTRAPVVTDLEIEGEGVVRVAPKRIPDLFAGSPALVLVELQPGCRSIRVRGEQRGGTFEQVALLEPCALGGGHQAIVQRFGRELVEDLETTLAAGAAAADVDASVERAGLDFQISTRLTSWVAVTSERTVRPGQTPRTERVPHELPYGTSIEGLGLRGPAAVSSTLTGGGISMTRAGVMKGPFTLEDLSELAKRPGADRVKAASSPPYSAPYSAPHSAPQPLQGPAMEMRSAPRSRRLLFLVLLFLAGLLALALYLIFGKAM